MRPGTAVRPPNPPPRSTARHRPHLLAVPSATMRSPRIARPRTSGMASIHGDDLAVAHDHGRRLHRGGAVAPGRHIAPMHRRPELLQPETSHRRPPRPVRDGPRSSATLARRRAAVNPEYDCAVRDDVRLPTPFVTAWRVAAAGPRRAAAHGAAAAPGLGSQRRCPTGCAMPRARARLSARGRVVGAADAARVVDAPAHRAGVAAGRPRRPGRDRSSRRRCARPGRGGRRCRRRGGAGRLTPLHIPVSGHLLHPGRRHRRRAPGLPRGRSRRSSG